MTDPAQRRQSAPGDLDHGAPAGATGPPALEHRTWAQRRRDKVAEEIARNRRGEYTVPTWVLATILCAIVVAWVAVVVLAG